MTTFESITTPKKVPKITYSYVRFGTAKTTSSYIGLKTKDTVVIYPTIAEIRCIDDFTFKTKTNDTFRITTHGLYVNGSWKSERNIVTKYDTTLLRDKKIKNLIKLDSIKYEEILVKRRANEKARYALYLKKIKIDRNNRIKRLRRLYSSKEVRYILARNFYIGMSEGALVESIGRGKTNTSVGCWGTHVQHCYKYGLYIYVENGFITSYQR